MALPSVLFDNLLKTLDDPFNWTYYGSLYSTRFNIKIYIVLHFFAIPAYNGNDLDLSLAQMWKLAKAARKTRAAKIAYYAGKAVEAEQARQQELLDTLKDGLSHAEESH
jgi:hypothetical protein